MKRVEGVDVEFPGDVGGDVGGAVGAQDVEGEAAHAGERSGLDPDAAVIFEEGHVPDVVIAVLDAPVGSDGGADLGGGQGGLTGAEGNLLGLVPEAGFGMAVFSKSMLCDRIVIGQ